GRFRMPGATCCGSGPDGAGGIGCSAGCREAAVSSWSGRGRTSRPVLDEPFSGKELRMTTADAREFLAELVSQLLHAVGPTGPSFFAGSCPGDVEPRALL